MRRTRTKRIRETTTRKPPGQVRARTTKAEIQIADCLADIAATQARMMRGMDRPVPAVRVVIDLTQADSVHQAKVQLLATVDRVAAYLAENEGTSRPISRPVGLLGGRFWMGPRRPWWRAWLGLLWLSM